jgi:hypothetical protein
MFTDDLRRHVAALAGDNVDFYGYAILPEDYTTITDDDPPSITVAFNCESDIAEANVGNVYYRFSPDEWKHYIHAGFDNTNAALRSLYVSFTGQFYNDPDDAQCQANRGLFFDCVHRTYLNSLSRTRADSTFATHIFLVIWIPCSSYNIIGESAKTLNPAEVYDVFVSEFAVDGG